MKLPFRPKFNHWNRALLQFVTPDFFQRERQKKGQKNNAYCVLMIENNRIEQNFVFLGVQ